MSLPDLVGGALPIPLPVPDWSKPIILALLLLSAAFGGRARVNSVRARRLERRQRILTADLGAMQTALVPEIPGQLGALNVSVAYRPADGPAAGGDFYDAFALDGGRVAVILGDVSGHGRAALAHAARMRYMVRAYVEAGLAPGQALALAGGVVGQSADHLFTTVVVAVYDGGGASLTYATAGHPPPLTLRAGAHEPLTICASPALRCGVPSGRRQTTVPFPAGACACFFSDGLIEASTDGELLGRRRLGEMFGELGPHPSASSLLEAVRGCAGEIRDDMATCVIEASGSPADAGEGVWLEEVELNLGQIQQGHARRFLKACGVGEGALPEVVAKARAVAFDHGLARLAVRMPGKEWTVSPPRPVTIAVVNSSPKIDVVRPLASPDHRLQPLSTRPKARASA